QLAFRRIDGHAANGIACDVFRLSDANVASMAMRSMRAMMPVAFHSEPPYPLRAGHRASSYWKVKARRSPRPGYHCPADLADCPSEAIGERDASSLASKAPRPSSIRPTVSPSPKLSLALNFRARA